MSTTIFGRTYAIDFTLTTSVGSALVRSGWIVRHGEDFLDYQRVTFLERLGGVMTEGGMNLPPLLAEVALLVDVPEHGLTRGEPELWSNTCRRTDRKLFSSNSPTTAGRTYAMPALPPDQVIALHRRLSAA